MAGLDGTVTDPVGTGHLPGARLARGAQIKMILIELAA